MHIARVAVASVVSSWVANGLLLGEPEVVEPLDVESSLWNGTTFRAAVGDLERRPARERRCSAPARKIARPLVQPIRYSTR